MKHIFRSLSFLLLLGVLGCSTPRTATQSTAAGTNHLKWEKEIAAFEASDKTNPPPQGAILFVGSSSIRFWTNLARDFPAKQVINRGFGGSEISDSIALADRIIVPYQPRLIVLYAGNNDLANGKSPERVIADFKKFLKLMHAKLPKARVAYISIHPNPARWHLKDKAEAVNKTISEIKDRRFTFINIWDAMLGEDGKPRPELFRPDKLHMNEKGYAIWTPIIRPYLDK